MLVLEVDGDGGVDREQPSSKTRAGCQGRVVMVLTESDRSRKRANVLVFEGGG